MADEATKEKPPHEQYAEWLTELLNTDNNRINVGIADESEELYAVVLFAMIALTKWQPEHKNMLLEIALSPWEKGDVEDNGWWEWVNNPSDSDGKALRALVEKLGGTPPPYPED